VEENKRLAKNSGMDGEFRAVQDEATIATVVPSPLVRMVSRFVPRCNHVGKCRSHKCVRQHRSFTIRIAFCVIQPKAPSKMSFQKLIVSFQKMIGSQIHEETISVSIPRKSSVACPDNSSLIQRIIDGARYHSHYLYKARTIFGSSDRSFLPRS
jgi:hypothetical protein